MSQLSTIPSSPGIVGSVGSEGGGGRSLPGPPPPPPPPPPGGGGKSGKPGGRASLGSGGLPGGRGGCCGRPAENCSQRVSIVFPSITGGREGRGQQRRSGEGNTVKLSDGRKQNNNKTKQKDGD